jgi:four helix bundle protein
METRKSKLENRNADGNPAARVKDFTDLDVWKVARAIYRLASSLPDLEKFGLASQLRRAATSVTANLAERYGRHGYRENVHFCQQARGSIYELRDHLTTCLDAQYLNEREAGRLDALAQRVTQILNGYLRSTLALKGSEPV